MVLLLSIHHPQKLTTAIGLFATYPPINPAANAVYLNKFATNAAKHWDMKSNNVNPKLSIKDAVLIIVD